MSKKNTGSENRNSDFTTIKEFITSYLLYWKLFAISIVVCVVLGYSYYKLKDPVYNIQASLVIKTDGGSSGKSMETTIMKAAGFDGLSSSSSVEDEVSILRSQSLMRKMISELNLNTVYTIKKFPFDKSVYRDSPIEVSYDRVLNDTLVGYIGLKVKAKDGFLVDVVYNIEKIGTFKVDKLPTEISTVCGKFKLDKKHSTLIKDNENFELSVSIVGLDYAAEGYRGAVDVGAVSRRSNVIALSYMDTNKERGKDILNKVIDLYNRDALNDKNEAAQNSSDFIAKRIDIISEDLDVLERTIEEYKKSNNITDIKLEAEMYTQSLTVAQKQEIEFEVQYNVIRMLEDYMNDPANKYSLIPTSMGLPSSAATVIDSYNNIVLERIRSLKNMSESNPSILTLNDQIDVMRGNVVTSIAQIKRELNSSKKDWAKKEGELQSQMRQMPTYEREYINMQRRQAIMSELYVFLLQKKSEAELTLASNTAKAKIIDPAFNVFSPVSPKKNTILAIAFIIGVCIPIVLIYLKNLFKFKLTNVEELEDNTSLPVLGEICLDKSGERTVVKEGRTSSSAELFRLLRANTQFILEKDEKVILITSSISGEGKSFFTLNMALSFALLKDKKVLIVGLDIRSPKMTEYLGVKAKTGITEYLASDDMQVDDIIVPLKDIHQNLDFIPSGPIPPNPAELLLREKLDDLFVELRTRYDYILVDTAPVGMVSDTFTLDRIADMTLYLFRANYTNKSNLRMVESIVETEKLKNLSLVMNGTSTKKAYGYGYGAQNKN